MQIFLVRFSLGPDGFAVPGILVLIILGILSLFIVYLFTLQKTLKAVDPSNRRMAPGMVWLMLIPFFNLVWHFVIVDRMAGSIRNQLIDAHQPPLHRPATHWVL